MDTRTMTGSAGTPGTKFDQDVKAFGIGRFDFLAGCNGLEDEVVVSSGDRRRRLVLRETSGAKYAGPNRIRLRGDGWS